MDHRTRTAPPDLDTAKETARLVMLLDADGELPDGPALDTFAVTMRGMIEVLAPEVEALAHKQPEDDVPRACALACVGEARMRLRLGEGDSAPVRQSVVIKLARSVNALCDHYLALAR
ncbi:DUF6415 family natural product biosynthesis protein [Streptomyces violaceorubidus]